MKFLVSICVLLACAYAVLAVRVLQARAFQVFLEDKAELVWDQRDDLVSKYGHNYATEAAMERVFPKVNLRQSWDNFDYIWPWDWNFEHIVAYGGRDYL